MSGQRNGNASNRIRGPQSALTDYLASHNISAAQIRDDADRRRQEAADHAAANEGADEGAENGAIKEEEAREETAEQIKKRKRQEARTIAKIKQSKGFKKRKKAEKDGEPDGDEDNIAWDMFNKATPLPGQLENCELCEKRFTVTPYSKTGPDGGLLCAKCSKEQRVEKKSDQKAKKQVVSKDRRRQFQSNLLDGLVGNGSKALLELCVEKVANNINDVDEFGDLPESLLHRLSQILSKKRVVTSRTLDLFLKPDLDTVSIYDCSKLEVDDYIKIFAFVPQVRTLNLRNAGQFKDEVFDYLLERDIRLESLQLEAANLVSDKKWCEFFEKKGRALESLKLAWLDYSMDDDTVSQLVKHCPNLRRLKLKKCFKLGDGAVEALSTLTNLEHLSLRLTLPIPTPQIVALVESSGPKLRTLSLENFEHADDSVLETIHNSCTRLSKLRFTENDFATDAGFAALFTEWSNPPLAFIDLSSTRDIDYTNPKGPEEPTGLASEGFKSLMTHSGALLESLDISSCRHIQHAAFAEVFDGMKQYPFLKDINLSFITTVDTPIVAGIFKCCPKLAKLTAFCCFNVKDVLVPERVALIGVPNAHDSIVQSGGGSINAGEFLSAMEF